MKKIILLLMMIFSFAFSAIDEYRTDIFFANGILVKKEVAKYHTFEVLQPAIIG